MKLIEIPMNYTFWWGGGGHLRTFTPKVFPRSVFSKLLLRLDNDRLISEKQTNSEVTVLASEIKRIRNVVFLEALVM